jgi:Mediator complex subunit MED14
LKIVNTLLHLRLTLHEVIPLPLSNYTIADGKVTFTVPNEWQLSITIAEEFGRWWFVDFKDHNGNDLGERMKGRVHQILEDVFEQYKIEYGLFPMGVTEESLRSMNKKAPLVEVYNILRTILKVLC